MKKIYYKLELKQLSPLRIGNAESNSTDSDLMTDGIGLPFIPGSSLAGKLRSMLEIDTGDRIFGFVAGNKSVDSKVIVSDGILPRGAKLSIDSANDETEVLISKRDGVGLDDWKTAIKGAKYDFQIAQSKLPYTSVIEYDCDDASDEMDDLMQRVAGEGITLGARSTRGYGSFSVDVWKRVFEFPSDIKEWLEFDPFSEDFGGERLESESTIPGDMTRVEIEFSLKDGFIIREKKGIYEVEADNSVPDTTTIKNMDNPVIPGTAWAGAFRHHMRDIARECGYEHAEEEKQLQAIDRLFGKTPVEGDHRRSSLIFSESEITGSKEMSYTRNAVDSFTQAPVNTAVFTTRFIYGGNGKLCISFDNGSVNETAKSILAIAINDLNMGLMSIGGEGGIGHGMMQINKLVVNGCDKTSKLSEQSLDIWG